MVTLARNDIIGLVHPSTDVHTLGIVGFSHILEACGLKTEIADEAVGRDLERLAMGGGAVFRSWIAGRGITALGFSYRLDPDDAVRLFGALRAFLQRERLMAGSGGRVRAIYVAGLPDTCDALAAAFPDIAGVFKGDETPNETLKILGLPEELMPSRIAEGVRYDSARLAFAEELIARGGYKAVKPVDRSGYPAFGERGDRLAARIDRSAQAGLPPLFRLHAGPYLPDRKEAVRLFLDWTKRLAAGGYLDILSIGTSQLTQSAFGEDWTGKVNGGGVPIATAEEFHEVWRAARPMLVRTYAGSSDLVSLARMYEETLDIAWHALSFWWFCAIDGRGPNGVLQNLREHFDTMRFIASSGKPLEANVPHHFAFRGSDDLGYVVSGYMAAKAAKSQGIRHFVLQIMLNTPKATWGIQDLAKARVLLRLVKRLESDGFRVFLQTRGGLDYFSPDEKKAKAQLAAVTMLMDDIEPDASSSPQIIHVVSYSEAYRLADPPVMEESIQITRHALDRYRLLKRDQAILERATLDEIAARDERLMREALTLIHAIETLIPDAYSPMGMYTALKSGAFPLPWLTSLRNEFPVAASMQTAMREGGVVAVDAEGLPIPVEARVEMMKSQLSGSAGKGGAHA